MFDQLFAFKHWADERTLNSILEIDGRKYAQEAAFARQQLNHIVIVQELFRARFENQSLPHKATNSDVVPDIEALARRLRLSNDWYKQFVSNRDQAVDDVRLSVDFTDGKKGAMTQFEILFHIVNHASYHRGTIARNLDLAGVPHPADIFTLFLHETEPDRREGG